MTTIPPVFILSTGRCGSTMVSNILNRHPRVLSLSEFFGFLGLNAFRHQRPTGDQMWRLYSRQSARTRLFLREPFDELLYPVDDPTARFTLRNVPTILCVALPHLTDRHENLFDEFEPVVRRQPRQPVADHYRRHFEWLGDRFGRDVWVERSGGSLLLASTLLPHFPEARVIHVYRDGRETALSMNRHPPFRTLLAIFRKFRSWGIDAAASMVKAEHPDWLKAQIETLMATVINPDRLPYDQVPLADFAELWSLMIEMGHRIFGHFPPDRLLPVRFEDMQADPENQIRRLIRFIDPRLEDDAWLREVATVPRPTPSKFQQIDPGEQAAITEACRPGLNRLGYPLEGAFTQTS